MKKTRRKIDAALKAKIALGGAVGTGDCAVGSVSDQAGWWSAELAATIHPFRGSSAMHCPRCQSTAVTERPERTSQGYSRFRCSDCAKQFNERSSSLLNRTQYPSDVIALVVLWRLRYKLKSARSG